MAVENVNDKLNPKLWKKEELKPEVKEKLFAIAENFISNIKEDEIDLKMKDLIIVGSNANFNYNETSDIDLHIIADMSKIEDDEEKRLLCILYNAYKALFNNKYDIVVKGHEVEIYVEPDETAVRSGGIYSLLNGWIKKPSREVFVASDEETEEFEKQFKEWEDRYKEIIEGEEIPEKGIEEALIHPEHYNKKVEIIVGNALSREIERRFGSDIIEKEIQEKNRIRYVVPYDQRLEHFIKQFNRTYKIVESVESGAEAKISKIDAFIKDFYELRKSALKTGSENSIGNKIFKQFRKLGYLKTLKDLKTAFEEKEMSLEKLETSNNLTESKADEQRLIDFAGESLAKRFLSIKNRLKSPENDIYYWLKKDVVELEDKVNEIENTISKTKQKKIEKTEGAELVVEENGWKVYRIDNYESSCLYGKGTKWCTASTETSSHFDDYKDKGIVLYYFIKNNEKYALALYSKIVDGLNNFGIKSNYELYDATDKLITDIQKIKQLNLPKIPGVDLIFEVLPNKIEGDVLVKVYPYNQGEFVIPDGIKTIGAGAFRYCTALKSITIPSSVTTIGAGAFHYCTALKSITIPSSVTTIGKGAFGRCNSLTSITIPSSVISIDDYAFYNCFSLIIYAEASEKPSGWKERWNHDYRPVVWNYKKSSNEELKEDIKMITDEELFWHLRDGLVNQKGDYINKTKYSERAKEVLDIFEGNIYVNSSGELDLYPNPDNMFAVSPEQYPKHLLNRDSLLKFKDAVKGEIVMFYNSTDEYGSEYSVLTSHEDLAIKACKGELGKEFAKQRAYAKYVDGEYQEVEINKNMLVSESANKLYNKNKGEYKNMKTMKEIKSMKITESVEIFDILGIEEENRESSKHLISQYKELQKKFPQASIWLNGDVDVYVKGKVLGKTADLSAVEERAVEEGGHGSGNFKSGAQRYNDKKDKIFSRYNAEQERFAKFLLDHEVSAEEVEKLKQDSGLHGNPLAKKYFELKKQLEEKVVEPELPTEVVIDGELLVDDIDDIGEAYLDEVISDWLSDEYGVIHLGFDYDVVGTDVHVFNILWDTSDEYSLEESVKLNEATANFGTNDIINLCSPYVDPDGYRDYADELREEEPDITEEEIAQRISEVVDNDYTDMYEQVNSYLEEVDDYVIVEPGYYEGFYIKFKFNDGLELAENWFYYDKEYALQEFKNTVEKIKQGLKKSVEQDQLVEYSVAYRASNGETGYNLVKEKEQSLKKIEETMNKILKEGLEEIEKEFIDEI